MLIPASCTGYPVRIKYGPITKNQVSIVLWGVATNSEPLNYAYIDQGFLLVPDGTTSASNPAVSFDVPPRDPPQPRHMLRCPGAGQRNVQADDA